MALGIVHASVEPQVSDATRIADALAFGIGLVFVIMGRAELFNENFFDPVATAIERPGSWLIPELLRLWIGTFVFNLVGGVLLVLVLSVDGALPPGTGEALRTTALEVASRGVVARFANAVAGGALVALLSHLLVSVDSVESRISMAYIVGVLLALGPFDHVIVTVLHVFFGIQFGADVGLGELAVTTIVTTTGNLVEASVWSRPATSSRQPAHTRIRSKLSTLNRCETIKHERATSETDCTTPSGYTHYPSSSNIRS